MSKINGPLNFEAHGQAGAPPMVFVHPNPMDNTSWMYQVAHFSTWFRCISIDLPGYGRSPSARPGLAMEEIAAACWDAVDQVPDASGRAVLVGCSVGSEMVQHMYHLRPEHVSALVVSGASWKPVKDYTDQRIRQYGEGIGIRFQHALDDFSPQFRESPMGQWFARMFVERNQWADAETIATMFKALAAPDPEYLQRDLNVPVLIQSGSLDVVHKEAYVLRDRLPNAELVAFNDVGHACQIEQPWKFDAEMIRFLRKHGHDHLPAAVGAPADDERPSNDS